MKLNKRLFGSLTKRYQLVIRNEETLAEKSTFCFSYAKLISVGTMLFSMLVVCSLALATTILDKWLNPAHIEQENEEKIVQLASAVDKLEQQINQQKKFITLLQSIIAGKEPPADGPVTANDKQTGAMRAPYSSAQPMAADTLLRGEFGHRESSPPVIHSEPIKYLPLLFLAPSIQDIVTPPFIHRIKHYGVNIVAKEKDPVKCVSDGVVTFSAWTVATGWVMVVQHNKDSVFIYKHNTALLKKVGNLVKKGEVIAIAGSSGVLSSALH